MGLEVEAIVKHWSMCISLIPRKQSVQISSSSLCFFFPFWVVVRESSAVYCDECSLIKIIAEAITFPVLGTGRFTASNKFREVVMGLPCTALFLPTIHILAKHYNFLNKVRSKM